MTVRTFTTPTALNEALSTLAPRFNDIESSLSSSQLSFDPKHSNTSHRRRMGVGVTFANQDSLPKLPIPELESTCQKYLDALKPLQSPREQHDSAAAVQEFLKRDGPDLDARLKRYATGKTSYIEQFCMFRDRWYSFTA